MNVNLYWIGLALRVARRKNKIGRERLALLLGITKKELIKFENGRGKLEIETIIRIFSEGIENIIK
jgi:DNA-binding XRE family transcriptional regulator